MSLSIIDYDRVERLVVDAQKGNKEAFEELYLLFYRQQLSTILALARNDEIAEEVVQEAFVSAYQNLSSLDKPRAFHKWLSRISYNKAMNRLGKKNAESSVFNEDGSIAQEADAEDEDILIDPERKMMEQEKNTLLAKCMEALSAEHRAVLVYHYYEGMNAKEIAQVTGAKTGAIYKRLFDARAALKSEIARLSKNDQQILKKAPAALAVSVFMDKVNGGVHAVSEQENLAAFWEMVSGTAAATSTASISAASAAIKSHVAQKALIAVGVTAVLVTGVVYGSQTLAPAEETSAPVVEEVREKEIEITEEGPATEYSVVEEGELPELPTLSIINPQVSYPRGTMVSLDQIIQDANISAVDASGNMLAIETSYYELVDFDYVGEYLIAVKAVDAAGVAANTQVITVQIYD